MTPNEITLTDAIRIAAAAHGPQVDKNGQPYIFHPLRVAERLSFDGAPEWLVTCAVLHDVVEDTDYSLDDLRVLGASRRQLDVLQLLTHAPGTPYLDYVYKIAENPHAATVKIADIRDNLLPWRLDRLTDKQRKRAEAKYPPALFYLEGRTTFGLTHDEVAQKWTDLQAQGGQPWKTSTPS